MTSMEPVTRCPTGVRRVDGSRGAAYHRQKEGRVTETRTFTAAELAQHNGQNGARAYIAFKGKVYDVTDSPLWTDGDHLGAHQAGADLTAEIDAAPHGPENLDRVTLVGVLAS